MEGGELLIGQTMNFPPVQNQDCERTLFFTVTELSLSHYDTVSQLIIVE